MNLVIISKLYHTYYLDNDVNHDDQEWISKVEEEPDLNGFDGCCGGQAGGDREVDRGKDHHAGDVDSYNKFTFIRGRDIVGGLVDDVHQDGGQVGHQDNAANISSKLNCYDKTISSSWNSPNRNTPSFYCILPNR